MALPNQLKSARMTDATLGKDIDDNVGDLEVALCDIFGLTIDTNVTETPLALDNSGRITKQLLRLAAAAPMGIRFRDTTNSKEFRLSLNNTSITLDENTGSEGTPAWTNRLTVALATGLPTLAAATDPTDAKDLTRKGYVDAQITAHTGAGTAHAGATNLIHATGAETLAGVKTFSSIPVLPATNPTADNEAARKAYVDDAVNADSILLAHIESAGNHAGGQASGSWVTRTINTELHDTGNHCSLASNEFTLAAGTYEIEAIPRFQSIGACQARLYNVSDSLVQKDVNNNEIYGMSDFALAGTATSSTHSTIMGRFTLASSKTLRIESQTQGTNTIYGWGSCVNFGSPEVYLLVKLRKVA